MAGTPYVPSSRLARVPPARSAVAVAWAVDVVVAAVFFFGTVVCVLFLLIPWGIEPGDSPVHARLYTWAAWTGALVGLLAAAAGTGLGREKRSPGRQLAEIRTSDLAGGPAAAWRRLLRAAVLPALCLAAAPAGLLLSAGVAVALLAICLVARDRRGLADRLSGLRDYQTDIVPVTDPRLVAESGGETPAPT
jgi:hypothetical protein